MTLAQGLWSERKTALLNSQFDLFGLKSDNTIVEIQDACTQSMRPFVTKHFGGTRVAQKSRLAGLQASLLKIPIH